MGFWKLVWKKVEVEGRTLEKAFIAHGESLQMGDP